MKPPTWREFVDFVGGGQRPAPKAAAAAGGGGVASLGIPEKARTPAEDIEEKWGDLFFLSKADLFHQGSLNNFEKDVVFFFKKPAIFFDVKILIASSPLFQNHFTNLCFRFQALISPIKMHEEISESHGREKIVSKGHNETPLIFSVRFWNKFVLVNGEPLRSIIIAKGKWTI